MGISGNPYALCLGERKQGSDLPPGEHWGVLGAAGGQVYTILKESYDQTDKGIPCAEGWVGVAGSPGPQGVK